MLRIIACHMAIETKPPWVGAYGINDTSSLSYRLTAIISAEVVGVLLVFDCVKRLVSVVNRRPCVCVAF